MHIKYIHTRKNKRILRAIGKRGSLELSINAIVVLILAITMLGLGLGFMRSTFGRATEQFKTVSKEVEKQLIDRLKQSEEPVSLSVYSVEMEKSAKETILLGIRNNLGCTGTTPPFSITVMTEECSAIGDGAESMCEKVHVNTFAQQVVEPNNVGIVPVNIRTDSTVVPSTVRIPVLIENACEQSGGSISERVELIVNVI